MAAGFAIADGYGDYYDYGWCDNNYGARYYDASDDYDDSASNDDDRTNDNDDGAFEYCGYQSGCVGRWC